MRVISIYIFLLCTICLFSQEQSISIYKNLKEFSTKTKDSVKIEEIILNYNKGNFNKTPTLKSYKKLGNNTCWFQFPLSKQTKDTYKYLTIDNPYLSYGKIYIRTANNVKELHRVSYFKEQPFKFIFYRLPVWKIPTNKTTNMDVFIELKNEGGRSRLEMFLEDENTFLKRTQTEYIQYGLFISFLISMISILLYFSILKKEYSVIFYALYIITVLIAFLAGTGLGIQFFWSENSFLTHSIRSFSQTFSVFFMGLFYLNFYKFKNHQKLSKNIFKWGVYVTIPLIMVYVYKSIFGGLTTFFLYVWTLLKLITFVWFCTHIYLVKKKQLPFYLVFAFALPIITIIVHQNINPSVYLPYWLKTVIKNAYYFALIIEILLFIRYIFAAVISTQQKYFKLKKLSNELQYNFQNKALKIQQEERNKLVNNVHDTFGGYLEALKLRLLQKNINTPEKTQEILDAFYKEYRYLLNSLYAPKINSENFTENLIEFCHKLDNLIDSKIEYHFNLDKTELSQEKCVHLYSIISELVTNAIKHSKASEIYINLKLENTNSIILEVSDNGVGFNQNKLIKDGFGIENIKNRVMQIHGNFKVTSSKLGTKITIKTPTHE